MSKHKDYKLALNLHSLLASELARPRWSKTGVYSRPTEDQSSSSETKKHSRVCDQRGEPSPTD